MYIKKLLIALMLSSTLSALITPAVFAADKYISEDLSVYLRRGPGTQYGIVGSLKAGDPVSVLETSSDGKYTRIKDDKNRISWIESDLLSSLPSAKERVAGLEQELALLKDNADNSNQDKQDIINDHADQLTQAKQKISELEKMNNTLQMQVNEQSSKMESINDQLDEKKQSLILSWFLRGGLVAGIGLVIGLILPAIIPRRRKKDRWM